jgi:hypothetical protein
MVGVVYLRKTTNIPRTLSSHAHNKYTPQIVANTQFLYREREKKRKKEDNGKWGNDDED